MNPTRIQSITEFHRLRGLPTPKHPLISVVSFSDMKNKPQIGEEFLIFDFYSISIKRGMGHTYRYGQQTYDFDEGILFFMAPKQVLRILREESSAPPSGWMLLIHPDFLWNKPLAKTIHTYDFFTYSLHEALFLSAEEENQIHYLIESIKSEHDTRIDTFSEDIILSQIETLLQYSDRFYHRQFITRKKANHEILERLELLLQSYFSSLPINGLPSVAYISDALKVSPRYLRKILHMLTGQTTQQYIHHKLTEKAKEKLSTTQLSVTEIAYELGFEHPQSFTKFFKTRTQQTPLSFRESFLD